MLHVLFAAISAGCLCAEKYYCHYTHKDGFLQPTPCLMMFVLCRLKNKLGQAVTVLRMYHHKVGNSAEQQFMQSKNCVEQLLMNL